MFDTSVSTHSDLILISLIIMMIRMSECCQRQMFLLDVLQVVANVKYNLKIDSCVQFLQINHISNKFYIQR